jgi:hypothetical protein
MPKIPNMQTWQQAELLLQPAYIRLLDNWSKQLENANWQSHFEDVTDPHPGHAICLQRGDIEVRYNLWSLCYQICFLDYDPDLDADGTQVVEVDPSLIEPDTGEVDWQRLESKTQDLVSGLLADLERSTSESSNP